MNRRFISVFGFALAVSTIATAIVYQLLTARLAEARTQLRPAPKVWVAAHTLEAGTLIADADLKQMPTQGPVPKDAITSKADLIGRGVIAQVFEGETVAEGRLAPKGGGAGLASLIPVGKRAVALRINEVVGLAGFVVPGMRVDVIVAGNTEEGGMSARTILQNIEVLSAGKKLERHVDGRPEEAQVVNLLVTPEQAEVLSLAGSETRVQLVLRNPLDTTKSQTKGTSMAAIFGLPVRTPAPMQMPQFAPRPVTPPVIASPEPAKNKDAVEVFSGTRRSDQPIEN